MRSGLTVRQKSLLIQARFRHNGEHIGQGFTATKKIGNAVKRNRAKRRLRAAAHQLLPDYGLNGVDYVFIARQSILQVSWDRLLDDMKKALISLSRLLKESQQNAWSRAEPDTL